jgi:serine/threonine-protein kinase
VLRPFEFKHDGGEIIFHLPNGLQGYLLVDGQDGRIADGPPDVVEDSAKTLGNAIIVNGLSCMACHKQGMRREFEDTVRFGAQGLSARARDQVRQLYLDPPDMNRLLEKDQDRFLAAVEACVGPFLRGAQDRRSTAALDEPIGPVAKRFLVEELNLSRLAAELGLNGTAELSAGIRFNPQMAQSLTGLLHGGELKRETWESGSGTSLFQQVAFELKLGTPASVIPPQGR